MKVTIKGEPIRKASEQIQRVAMMGPTSLVDKIVDEITNNLCTHCGGAGRLRAMQSMAVIGGGSVRGPDTTTECSFCNGTGRR